MAPRDARGGIRFTTAVVLALAVSTTPGAALAADAPQRKIVVAAAASLRLPMQDLIAVFERRTPGVKVEATFGSTGALQAQVRQGAPYDVFLGADRDAATRLHEAGLGRGDPFPYAIGRLVLWVSAHSRVDPNALGVAAVTKPGIKKIAIANPAVAPYGVAAEQALRAAGFLDAVRPKLVLGESVLQVVQFAQTGNAEAAFVPWPFVTIPPLASMGRFIPVPPTSYAPIEQWGVVLSGGRDPALGEAFADFVRSPPGRTIIERHKYMLPPG